MVQCWNEWSSTVKKKHKYGDAVNTKGKRALARMLNECLFRCFAAWSEHIRSSRRNKETLKRVKCPPPPPPLAPLPKGFFRNVSTGT
jgi:hypothetical protein